MGVRIRGRLLCIVVKDTSKPTVSCLKFEPWSQNFLVTVTTSVAAVTHTTMGSLFCFNGYLCDANKT